MLSELRTEVEAFDQNPSQRSKAIRNLLEQSQDEFCAAALELISTDASERARRYLVAVLWANDLLINCLSNPRLPMEKAERIAALARRVDPQLPVRLIGFTLKSGDCEIQQDVERVLALLPSMSDSASLRPLLTPLLQHSNPRIRSKAALLSGSGNPNRAWIERRMQADDPRVRANVIEAAGPNVSENIQPIFRAAAQDANNRVAGNALVALYRFGDTAALAELRAMSSRPEAAFRATAAWAMGDVADTRFLPLVARMLRDPERMVKSAAVRALQRLHAQESAEAALPEVFRVHVVGQPEVETSRLRLVLSVTRERQPCHAIPPISMRIFINGETAFVYSVTDHENRWPLACVALIPVEDELTPTERADLRQSLEDCFARRYPGDTWLVGRFSRNRADSGGAEKLFGVRMDAPESSVLQPARTFDELRTIVEHRDPRGIPDLAQALLAAFDSLGTVRTRGHVFAVDPFLPPGTDSAKLNEAANGARVTVHALGRTPAPLSRALCHKTGGRYWLTQSFAGLPELYQSVRQSYQATVETTGVVRSVRAMVYTPDGWGTSDPVEIEG